MGVRRRTFDTSPNMGIRAPPTRPTSAAHPASTARDSLRRGRSRTNDIAEVTLNSMSRFDGQRIVLCYPVEPRHLTEIRAAAPGAELVDAGQERIADEILRPTSFADMRRFLSLGTKS